MSAERVDQGRVCIPAMHTPNNPQAPNVHQSPTLEGLPKQFVGALRTLFDILDEKRVGFVKLTDIENRWQDDGTKGLPKGVIESLRKVTPPNGLLSFERFCAGLKICLLRNQVEHKKRLGRNGNDTVEPGARPPSAPLLDMDSKTSSTAGRCVDSQWGNAGGTGPGMPRGVVGHGGGGGGPTVGQQRTLSMPQLPAEAGIGIPVKPPLYGPPKPPRLLHSRTAVGLSGAVDKSEIRSALQNWQIGMMMEEEKQRGPPPLNSVVSSGSGVVGVPVIGSGSASSGGGGGGPPQQGIPPGVVGYPNQPQRPRSIADGKPSAVEAPPGNGQHKKPNARRREPRRHTLQNGIDYNMLKRMKQIEQEKDVLMQGLEAVDRARDWYFKQIAAVQEKMKYLGRMGHTEHWSEAQDERLELQRARILEVNRHLATLTDPGERGGLPLHMNLAVNPHSSHLIARLKQQNHLLTQDVNKKGDRITALEREKASLIRELFHTRSQSRPTGQSQETNAFL